MGEIKKQPFTFAPITLVVAEQGNGKSTVLTARAVDATFAGLTSVKLSSGYVVQASPALNEKGKSIIGYATVYFPDKKPFVAKIPDGACAVADKIRIFANYHLYGIRYMYCDLPTILEHLNDWLLMDGWLLIDETYIDADNRNSMNILGKIMSQFGFQIRKRRLHLMLSYPLDRMAELRFRLSRTERITPTCNPKTWEITATIKRSREREKAVTFYAPLYWAYFDTEEKFAFREKTIAKAQAEAY